MNYSYVIHNVHDLIFAALSHTGARSLIGAFTLSINSFSNILNQNHTNFQGKSK